MKIYQSTNTQYPTEEETTKMPVTVEIPKEKWTGSVREVTLGATAGQGGTRATTVTVGGGTTIPFLHFEGGMPHPPVIAIEIQDHYPEDWSALLKEAWATRSTIRPPGPRKPRSMAPTSSC